jgi:hypothetical protein
MRQPFFKREADKSNMDKITDIQAKIDKKVAKIREAKNRHQIAEKDL